MPQNEWSDRYSSCLDFKVASVFLGLSIIVLARERCLSRQQAEASGY
jgi:hypothetical protein